jgi:hypothetical protein
MLSEALTALGTAGGTAVVGAMATDAWKTTRDHVVRLFARGGADRQDAIEAALNEDAGIVTDSDEAEREQVRRELLPVWQRRIVRLLDQYPDIATELQDLITQIHAVLPPGQQAWVQHNTATEGGTVIAHQGTGSQHIHYDRPPGSAEAKDPSTRWTREAQ